MRNRIRVGMLVAGVGAAAMLGGPAMAALSCTAQAIQSAAPKDTTITSTEAVAAPVAHCKVDGYVTATNPGPNRAYFRLQLPDKGWNGRFYFQGLGSAAGYLPSAGPGLLEAGFAFAGTDTGRQGSTLDWDFINDPVKALDHSHRAAHVTTLAAQQITKAYYGVEKMYRYESGCSGGGRMGMMSITRHPGDYDGVLAGDPGGRSSAATNLKFLYAAKQMMREPGAWLSPAKLAMIDKNVTAACDMTDGAKDGVVSDHRLCKFDVATLQCKAGDGPDCLTAPEVRSMQNLLAGYHGPGGKLIAQPFQITNVTTWSLNLGTTPPPWLAVATTAEDMGKSAAVFAMASSIGRGYLGPGFDAMKFDLNSQKDIDAWMARAKATDYGAPYDSDLRPMAKAGEKLMMFNGRSDSCCGDQEAEQYNIEARQHLGAQAADVIALYQIPGMGHCGGGTGPDDVTTQLLDELINWVEKGEKPGPVVSHRKAERAKSLPAPNNGPRDFLLCPYPQYPKFNAAMAEKPGATDDAANWSCYTPKAGEPRQG